MIELEKKILITKEEYHLLLERFLATSPLADQAITKQINYYFDTDDLSMNRQNITCRIRLKDGKLQGTIKQHASDTDQSVETEVAVRDGIHSNAFTDLGLKLQGELITERCCLLKTAACEVVLDKNEYLNYIDYELEVEYMSGFEEQAQSIVSEFLSQLDHKSIKKDGTQTRDAKSKSSRFFERRLTT